MLESPELFEPLQHLEPPGRQGDEAIECGALETVDADMVIMWAVCHRRHRSPAEI